MHIDTRWNTWNSKESLENAYSHLLNKVASNKNKKESVNQIRIIESFMVNDNINLI